MRIDPDECRDPELLAAEVRRLRAVMAAGEPPLTDEERAAIETAVMEAEAHQHESRAATLRKLLQRLGGTNA
jgi:hypothetical protein